MTERKWLRQCWPGDQSVANSRFESKQSARNSLAGSAPTISPLLSFYCQDMTAADSAVAGPARSLVRHCQATGSCRGAAGRELQVHCNGVR